MKEYTIIKWIRKKGEIQVFEQSYYQQLQFLLMMRLLRRLKFVGESQNVSRNIAKLRQRQSQQLYMLQPLKKQVNQALLDSSLAELAKKPSEQTFNTFATKCLQPEIRSLNGLADVNIERVFNKGGHTKIPFTVKDHLKVDEMITTCGFSDNLEPASTNSDVVELLERQGCIAYAHTNVPQGLLGIESSNSVYGRALNPHDPLFISGGSSGGEAIMVATKASAFGIGSDSGGSARVPAGFCGIYGFKPTGSKRLSVRGRVGASGLQGVKLGDLDASFGFMSRSVDDISWLCSKTLGKKINEDGPILYGGQWDHSRYQASKRKKLKVGYLYNNPEMQVAPGIINTINETLDLLKGNNHSIVEFNFPKLSKFRDFFFQIIHNTSFLAAVTRRMEGHYTANQIAHFYDEKIMSPFLYKLKYRQYFNDPMMRHILSLFQKEPTTAELFRIHKQIDDLRRQYIRQWNKLQLDVLITPVMPCTPLLAESTELLVYQLTFCCFQNILQLPAGVIPTRRVSTEKKQTQYTPKTIFEHDAAESIAKSAGLPLSIQVTGQHLMDQQCIGAMWQIQNLNGHYIQPKIIEQGTNNSSHFSNN